MGKREVNSDVNTVPFFSVVIPLYNKERSIRRAVSSVLGQSFCDLELIIVDDGSTDRGLAQIAYVSDDRMRIIASENGGVGHARNLGIASACGAWIAFLDADDEWLPEFLQKVYDAVHLIPAAEVIYTLSAQLYEGCRLNSSSPLDSKAVVVDYLRSVTCDGIEEMNSSCVAVRRTVFDRVGLFAEGVSLGEDTDMWLRLAWMATILHVPEVLAIVHADASGRKRMPIIEWQPYWLGTYITWRAKNMIPPSQVSATEAYRNKFVLERSIRLALAGRRMSAVKGLILEFQPGQTPEGLLLKTLAYVLFPVSLIRAVRAMIRRLAHSKAIK